MLLLAADGLLAIFFFGVGLELKRQIARDLRDPARAAVPIENWRCRRGREHLLLSESRWTRGRAQAGTSVNPVTQRVGAQSPSTPAA